MKGTFGTLGAIPLVFVFSFFGLFAYAGLTFAMIIFAWIVAEAYDVLSQNHDSPEVVIDEVAGFLITMTWLPLTWQAFVVGFVLFRFLDIAKPPPMSIANNRVRGGFGVVLDDVLAGVIANLILQLIYVQTDWLGVQYIPGS